MIKKFQKHQNKTKNLHGHDNINNSSNHNNNDKSNNVDPTAIETVIRIIIK